MFTLWFEGEKYHRATTGGQPQTENEQLLLPVVPRAGAWPVSQMQRFRQDMKTLSVAAPEAAALWSEQTEENPGCSSDTSHQPEENKPRGFSDSGTVQVRPCQYMKRTEGYTWQGLLVFSQKDETICTASSTSTTEGPLVMQAHQYEQQNAF